MINRSVLDQYNTLTLPIQDTWGVLFHKDSELASYDAITIDDIKDKPLILPNQDGSIKTIVQYFQLDLQQLNLVGTYNLVYNASLMAKNKIGYVICLKDLINTEQTDLVFKPFTPERNVSLTFIWKKYQVLNKSAQYFLQTVQESIQNHTK